MTAPRRLGKYELVAKIGEGGMAEVHLARQRGPKKFQKLVVLKLVHSKLASKPALAEALLDEARIAALVKHPNVIDIYDLGEEKGNYFIAMEYLEGESLASIPEGVARRATSRSVLDGAHHRRQRGGPARGARAAGPEGRSARAGAPGRHARQRDRPLHGAGEARRLRRGQGAHERGRSAGEREGGISRTRAVRGRGGGSSFGRVVARRRSVGVAGPAAAVRGEDRGRDVRTHPQRADRSAVEVRARGDQGPRRRLHEGARAQSDASLSVGARDARRPHRGVAPRQLERRQRADRALHADDVRVADRGAPGSAARSRGP